MMKFNVIIRGIRRLIPTIQYYVAVCFQTNPWEETLGFQVIT